MVGFVVIAVVASAVIVLAGWLLMTFVRSLCDAAGKILISVLRLRGAPTLFIDPSVTDNSKVVIMRRMGAALDQHRPFTALPPPPAIETYRSLLGFLPVDKVPGLTHPDDFTFFETPLSQDGHVSYQHLAPNQRVSSSPMTTEIGVLLNTDAKLPRGPSRA
jgi:hypothetical protein